MMSMVMVLPGSDLMLAPTLLAPVPVLVEYKALTEMVVGQFGTGQFGTKIVKTDNLAPRRQEDNLATKR